MRHDRTLRFSLPQLFFLAVALVGVLPPPADRMGGVTRLGAADWPMWRYDSGHRAASPQQLPQDLYLQWVLDLPEPRTAWPSTQKKLLFDRLYEPILVGKNLIVGSMLNDRLTAYDTETGKERWRFYTEAPIRLAPAAGNGKVYCVSDDGYLYCVDIASGKLVWKFRGGPSDRKVIGNHRLVSAWPARGAPVIHDGKIYFGASIWPFMGIFLHALDAKTGDVIWTNSGTGSAYLTQQHNSPAFAGVAPQGYIAVTGDRLLVAGGRTMPAVFDRKTGEFIAYHVSSRRMGSKGGGGYEVAAGNDYYFNRNHMYRLSDGKYILSVGAPVLTDYGMIGTVKQGIRAYQPGFTEIKTRDRKGNVTKKTVVKTGWTAPIPEKIRRVFLMSGSRIYCSTVKREILAVDLPKLAYAGGVSWRAKIPDVPLNMITGDDKLFVTTDRGRIYCYGGKEKDVRPAFFDTRVTVVPKRAEWRYLDASFQPQESGSDSGAAPDGWRTVKFDESYWPKGDAKLGYGDDDVVTSLSFGPDPKNKRIAYYFRRSITVPEEVSELMIELLADDGAVIYLNGTEVARHYMPEGDLTHETLAKDGNQEGEYDKIKLDPGVRLKRGKNLLAVQVHQKSPGSSDVAFDLQLSGVVDPKSELNAPRLPKVPEEWRKLAGSIVRHAGTRAGYCLALGLGSGKLVEALLGCSQLHVVVIDPDAAKVDAFRRRMDDMNVYGTRVAAVVGDPLTMTLPRYMADVIVAEDPGAAGMGRGGPFVRKVFRSLRPYTGLAAFRCTRSEYRAFAAAVKAADLDSGRVRRAGRFALLTRTDAPAGSGKWTHQYGDPGNSVASLDRRVRLPLGLLWFGGTSHRGILPRHGHGPTPQVVDGRLFIQGRDILRATDIYTGRLLWERRLEGVGKFYDYTSHEPGANAIGSNYVSLADGVYVVHNDKCLRLDPVTGDTISEFSLPPSSLDRPAPAWGYIGIWRDALIAGTQPTTFAAADYVAEDFKNLKDKGLRATIAVFTKLKGFEPVPAEKEQDPKVYLLLNLNKLLDDADLVGKIPEKVREKAEAEELEKKLEAYLEQVPGRKATDSEALVLKRQLLAKYYELPAYKPIPAGKEGSHVRTSSKRLTCLDRDTGHVRWEFEARYEIRHNAIALGGGMVFLIDRLSDARLNRYKRRGIKSAHKPRVVALDIASGELVWSYEKRVFGTWLGYSREHDLLLQAGSKGRDRATDEVGQGMVMLRGSTGDVVWENDLKYSGPCILVGNRLITQGYSTSGFALDIVTGERVKRRHPLSERPCDWQYTRNYGCNTAIASPNMLLFRSAAAGYFDLAGDGGTGNFGGFRSGCTSSLIAAGGILNAPDYTRTCTCSYQNQTSLALVHMPEVETWTFNSFKHDGRPVMRAGLNLGAPGDRRDEDGTLWLDTPSVGGPSPNLPVKFRMDGSRYLRHHSSTMANDTLPWVGASGVEGAGEVTVQLAFPNEFEILNEVAGKSPLTVKRGRASRFVPPKLRTAAARSLGRARGEDALEAYVSGYKDLASPSLTCELWVYPDGDLNYVDARGGVKQGFVIDNRDLRLRYFTADSGAGAGREVTIKSEETLPEKKWTHVAFTYDAGSGVGTLYRNGKVAGVDQGPEGAPLRWKHSAPKYVVAKGGGARSRVDELRVSHRALSAEELLYHRGSGGGGDVINGVIGYWRMDHPRVAEERAYSVRLIFAEIDGAAAGERVFDVYLQGEVVLRSFDIAAAAGGAARTVVKEFDGVPVHDRLRVTLKQKTGRPPLLNGLEVILDAESLGD